MLHSPPDLQIFPQCPGAFPNIRIRWPDEVDCLPSSTDVLSRLTSWLDPGSFEGVGAIRGRGAGDEELDIRLEER